MCLMCLSGKNTTVLSITMTISDTLSHYVFEYCCNGVFDF